jgi:hypothetical protein
MRSSEGGRQSSGSLLAQTPLEAIRVASEHGTSLREIAAAADVTHAAVAKSTARADDE